MTSPSGRQLACALLGLVSSCGPAPTGGARHELTVVVPTRRAMTLTTEQLLGHPSARSLVIRDSPAYPGRELEVTAVPIAALVPAEAASGGSVVFECLDGFAASVPAARLQGGGETAAFLAIEDPAAPWPSLGKDPTATAGPFCLVWTRAEEHDVSPEEWPYQVTRITVRDPPEKEFPAMVPDSEVAPGSPIARGFQVFVRQCLPCHTLNGAGYGHVGPDLNVPMNPTEYFRDGIFEKYLRDPTAVRDWPEQRMPAFSQEALPEEELDELRSYLEHMAQRRG